MTERGLLAAVASLLALAAVPSPARQMPSRAAESAGENRFVLRAPQVEPVTVLALEPGPRKLGTGESRGQRVGHVRVASKSANRPAWTPVAGGWVARLAVESTGAVGLRARLALPAGLDEGEIAVQGAGGAVEGSTASGPDAWTPWTPGNRQVIEVFSRRLPADAPVAEAIVHFDRSPLAKATAGACSPDVACSSGDPVRDAAIAERRRSVALITFVEGDEARVCSGTLLNTERFPTAFMVTANHCIATAAAAASVATIWNDEALACGATVASPERRQVAGGATLVYTSHGADSTLLQLKGSPPTGAVYAGWNAARLAAGEAIVSISHPQGDLKKFALGTHAGELLVRNYPQDMYGISYALGVTEGGSSGSGLFTLAGGSLQLRGVLSGSTLRSGSVLSCENAGVEQALFGRFEIFHPQIADYIAAAPPLRTDDYGNRVTEAQRIFPVAQAVPAEVAYPGRIDYAGDVDVFRVDIPAASGTLTVRTTGGLDTIGSLLDAAGRAIVGVNDVEASRPDFGLTRTLAPGTYYVAVAHREAAGTGAYELRASLSTATDNYTDLWWNAKEPGWGLNINHQGQVIFATLFVHADDGQPMWLSASSVTRQPNGAWQGTLYRSSGTAFNADPWTAPQLVPVGTLRIGFTGAARAELSYSAYGRTVNKTVERYLYSVAPICRWSTFDRSLTTNFQDLWWNPKEPGWGLNLSHQGDILFGTLFTYSADGRDRWLVMSRGERIREGLYAGELYATTGPPFSATAWTPAANTQVGTMSVQFTRGNAASLTYTVDGVLVVRNVQRLVVGSPATECFAPGNE